MGRGLMRIKRCARRGATMAAVHEIFRKKERTVKNPALKIGIAALAIAAGAALAQGPGYGPGMGYGPGAMGGYGYGYRNGGALAALDLTDEQREKILTLQEQNRRKNWDVMGQLRSEQFKLHGLYTADKVDANAVAEQQKKVDELRRQMIRSRVETHNQIEALLTPEQRKQFRQFMPWWAREGSG